MVWPGVKPRRETGADLPRGTLWMPARMISGIVGRLEQREGHQRRGQPDVADVVAETALSPWGTIR